MSFSELEISFAFSIMGIFILSIIPLVLLFCILGIQLSAEQDKPSKDNEPMRYGMVAVIHCRSLFSFLYIALKNKVGQKTGWQVTIYDGDQVTMGTYHVCFLINGLLAYASGAAGFLTYAISTDMDAAFIYNNAFRGATNILLIVFAISLVLMIWSYLHVAAQRRLRRTAEQLYRSIVVTMEQQVPYMRDDTSEETPKLLDYCLDYLSNLFNDFTGRPMMTLELRVNQYLASHRWSSEGAVTIAALLGYGEKKQAEFGGELSEPDQAARAFLLQRFRPIDLSVK